MKVCTPTPPPTYVWTLSLTLFWQFLSDELPGASTSTLSMRLVEVRGISKRSGTATTLHHTKSVSWRPKAKPKLKTISFISILVSSLFVFYQSEATYFWSDNVVLKVTNASSLENCFMCRNIIVAENNSFVGYWGCTGVPVGGRHDNTDCVFVIYLVL